MTEFEDIGEKLEWEHDRVSDGTSLHTNNNNDLSHGRLDESN